MLREVRAWDFCGYAGVKLNLWKQGLVWVGGDNRDSRAAVSNGAGKTTLFKLLTWVLYDKTLDGERNFDLGDKAIRHGAKLARGELDLEGGWTVRRERKKGSTRLELIQPDGSTWEGAKGEVQAKVIELVGLDFQAFRNTVLYGQNDAKRFAAGEVTDQERKAMLHRILRTEVLGVAHKIAAAKALAARKATDEADTEVRRLKERIDNALAEQEILKQRSADWATSRRARIEALKEEIAELREAADAATAKAPSTADLDRDMAAARERIEVAEAAQAKAEKIGEHVASLERSISDIRAEIRVAEGAAARAADSLDELAGDECSMCHAPLSGEGVNPKTAEHIKRLRDAVLSAEASQETHGKLLKAHRATLEKRTADWKKQQRLAAAGREAREELKTLSGKLRVAAEAEGRRDALVARAKAKMEAARALAAESNPHKEGIAAADKKHCALVDDWVVTAQRADDHRAKATALDFWVRGFGGQGLPSFVLDAVMPYLSERANHYLETLADGDITMEFSTQRALKSDKGAFRDEIAITWSIEGMDGYPPSGGQQRKMEIATDLALMDLTEAREGAGLSLFMADEILDGLDREGTERVLQMLHDLRSRRGSIYVVSHNENMAELFEHELVAIKEGGVSRLEVVR